MAAHSAATQNFLLALRAKRNYRKVLLAAHSSFCLLYKLRRVLYKLRRVLYKFRRVLYKLLRVFYTPLPLSKFDPSKRQKLCHEVPSPLDFARGPGRNLEGGDPPPNPII